jgi:hypothetical protein
VEADSSAGVLRLHAVPLPEGFVNFWDLPNLLLQKFPAPEFTATVHLRLVTGDDSESAGLIVMGTDYARLSMRRVNGQMTLSLVSCKRADRGGTESETPPVVLGSEAAFMRVSVGEGGLCRFSCSEDGEVYREIGAVFQARPGRWIGAKVGLFCTREDRADHAGYAQADWFRIEFPEGE